MSDETRPLVSGGDKGNGTFSRQNAQSAFVMGDVEMSKREHMKRRDHHTEAHGGVGDYIKATVFGGMDGILTTFCLISSVAGSASYQTLHPVALIILAVANLVADGFSMGCGEAMSQVAEYEYALKERNREQWEVENNLDGEVDEMVDIYVEKGMPEDDARAVMLIIAKHPNIFVDFMMKEELGITVETSSLGWRPLQQGATMMASFCFFGFIPVIAFIPAAIGNASIHSSTAAPLSQRFTHGHPPVAPAAPYSSVHGAPFYVSVALTVCALLVLGFLKGKVSERPPLQSALTLCLTGLCAALLSYLLGRSVRLVWGSVFCGGVLLFDKCLLLCGFFVSFLFTAVCLLRPWVPAKGRVGYSRGRREGGGQSPYVPFPPVVFRVGNLELSCAVRNVRVVFV